MADLSDEQLAIEQRRLINKWESLARDTTPQIERRRLAAAWSAPASRKLLMAAEMSQTTLDLTLVGLRRRHPDATEQEIRFRLASLLLGSETAHRMCGSEAEEKGPDAA